MRFGVIVNKGFEKAAVSHIRELLDIKSVHVHDTFVVFETEDWKDVYRFVYMNQIANRVVYLIDELEYEVGVGDEEIILKKISDSLNDPKKQDELFQNLIDSDVDFRSSVHIDKETDNPYLESEIGGFIINYAKKHEKTVKVNLRNPTMNYYVYINNGQIFLGIDLSEDLSKRDYKLFNNAVSLKGPTAFGLLMIAGYSPKDSFMNPCCYSGTLEIEAALYASGTSHRFYNKNFPFMKIADKVLGTNEKYWESFYKSIDSKRTEHKFDIVGSDKLLSSITAASKNAKIAGVIGCLNFRRVDLDWMDLKYEEKSVDKIISFIPGSSKHTDMTKEYKQIFYQAEYILKNKGTMTVMCLSKDLLIESSKEYLDLDKTIPVFSGRQEMIILIFKKKPKSKKSDKDEE
ncbi:MAG TPA: hypothetical protein VEC16_02320 [Alphaproteobacteria bacterium]|nr:hypothetical protein [Alphaproteobacteria bacterium]